MVLLRRARDRATLGAASPAPTARFQPLSEPPLIAIVDDDAAMREALDDLLQVAGLSSRTYAGAAAFLDDHAPGRFDLLITDLRMPQMDGVELLRRLAATDPGLPAIVVTSDSPSCGQAIEAGALACLGKPVDDDALLLLIDVVLGRERRERPEH
ncbi:MAG TPA: response regulator [Allosphingosinicella sp.]|nr:response regulator [Allosphingosinicella sp.]